MKDREESICIFFLIKLNSTLRYVFYKSNCLYLDLHKNIRISKININFIKILLAFYRFNWFDSMIVFKVTNILFSILFFRDERKVYYYYYVLFVIISIAFYSMNQQTRILFSNNSTLFSSRCHFSFQCETSACTFVC